MSDYVWGRKKAIHDGPEISGSLCFNCPEMECKPNYKTRLEQNRWSYYCDAMKKSLTRKQVYDITEESCPRRRRLTRKRFE